MIYKTLHWYIFRELMRIFLMTVSVLTTMLAFGGTFQPLTKEGLDVWQLMRVLTNLMPAMLAYAIPLAALFAAVLVYWRMATDNEVTACRAGGVSFWVVVLPALLLGLVVASADLVFVNYVVPVFLQRTEKMIQQDLGSLLVNKVGQREPFKWGKLVVYADRGSQVKVSEKPAGIDKREMVVLEGMAATLLDREDKPSAIVLAKRANVIIDEVRSKDEVHLLVQLDSGAAFDPYTFRKISGSVNSLPPDGTPWVVPSLFKDKPKFLNYMELRGLDKDPMKFGPLGDKRDAILLELKHQEIAGRYAEMWKASRKLEFAQSHGDRVVVTSPAASFGAERQLVLNAADGAGRVKVEQYRQGRLAYYYTCQRAEFFMSEDDMGTDAGAPSDSRWTAVGWGAHAERRYTGL